MHVKHINPHYRKGIHTSQKELVDLAKAWIILGVAFAIVMNGFKFDLMFVIALIISLLTLGVGFLFHELAHKFMAQRYGCFAEFRSFDKMLIFALIFSFFGFIFAAPGAVMIRGHLTRAQTGRISAAGPGMNLIVSILFLPLAFSSFGIWQAIGKYGFIINAWLALFNMIPFAMFDGKKIFDWNKLVYTIMAASALGLIVVQNLMAIGII
jgi:Zn-dependent protease